MRNLVSLAIERRRELLGRLLATPEDPLRLSPLLRAPSGQVLEAERKLGLEGVVGNGSLPATNPASDQAHGSSTALTENRVCLAVTSPGHGFDALLVGVYENKQLIFVAKVKTDENDSPKAVERKAAWIDARGAAHEMPSRCAHTRRDCFDRFRRRAPSRRQG